MATLYSPPSSMTTWMSPRLGHLAGAIAAAAVVLAALLRHRAGGEEVQEGEESDEGEEQELLWKRNSLARKLETTMASKLAAVRWREQIRLVQQELVACQRTAVNTCASALCSCSAPGTSTSSTGMRCSRRADSLASPSASPKQLPVVRDRSAPAALQRKPLELSVRSEETPRSSRLSDTLDHDGHVHSVIGMSVMTVRRDSIIPGTPLCALVEAMATWRQEFLEQRGESHDPFWHRKTKKIVLAVVALRTPRGPEFVRGCNLEVSMPSGSLCAERNAIGTAVAMYPDVQRENFRGVAVLSLTEGESNLNPLPPCGVCSEWLEKIVEVNPDVRSRRMMPPRTHRRHPQPTPILSPSRQSSP